MFNTKSKLRQNYEIVGSVRYIFLFSNIPIELDKRELRLVNVRFPKVKQVKYNVFMRYLMIKRNRRIK